MALDHALAACLADGTAVVRLYGWERPTISFGRNEPAAGLYSTEVAGADGIAFVRRPTGGRAVLHDRELTYAVVAPLDAWGGPRGAYAGINEALASALRALGAPVRLAEGGRALAPDAGPCFQAPAAGEVVAWGRKVVGSAQARLEGALLQHGSILLGGDQGRLDQLTRREAAGERSITLAELIGEKDLKEVADGVAEVLRGCFGGSWTSGEYDPSEVETADRLENDRYARDSWTWRR
jgi:lipoyl(octanoyl) transferase